MINNDLFNQQCAVSAVFYTYSSELYEMKPIILQVRKWYFTNGYSW